MPLTREEAAALRAKHKGDIAALIAKEKTMTDADAREVLMLERRLGSETFDADLGNGRDKIRLWGCLSEEEMDYLAELQAELTNRENPPTEERKQELIYAMIEELTVNEMITLEWLREHPGVFSMHDALAIYYIGVRMTVERALEVARIQNFRPESPRKAVR